MPADPDRSNAFDHLRLFAAWCVFVSHHFALWGRAEPQSFGTSLGGLGVNIFFSLSGYLVTLSLRHDPSAVRFLARRALRILPGLVVNVLLCVGVFGLALTTLPPLQFLDHPMTADYLMNLAFSPRFYLPGVLDGAPHSSVVNGSLWTLPFEVLAYLALVLLAIALRGRLRWVSPLLAVGSVAVLAAWRPPEPFVVWDNDLRHLPGFMALFFAGSTLAYFKHRWLRLEVLFWLLVVHAAMPWFEARYALMLWLIPCLAVYLGEKPPPFSRPLRGDCSYGVYLYAYPAQQAVIALGAPLGFAGTMVVAAALTYLLARLSWALVERPMLALKPRAKRAQV